MLPKHKQPAKIDWRQLARAVGSVDDSHPQHVGGTHVARLALEEILGPANYRFGSWTCPSWISQCTAS